MLTGVLLKKLSFGDHYNLETSTIKIKIVFVQQIIDSTFLESDDPPA